MKNLYSAMAIGLSATPIANIDLDNIEEWSYCVEQHNIVSY